MNRRPVVPTRARAARRSAGARLLVAAAVLAAIPVVSPLLSPVLSLTSPPACGPGGHALVELDGPLVCAHTDAPPPGVDVTEHVSTAELRERDGAGLAAYRAAEDLGVPMSAATNATSPTVPCDGDGTSGYRIQAMYVVEAGRTNRFASLLPSFQLWAAGTTDVINRSAALTGGVRDLRFVTEAGSGGCQAKVLNVTVPAGSTASFSATISAVQALGYTAPNRKYLMWTDATSLCGIASLYPNDGPSQGNPNNGSYAQYARVDSGCWGFGNGSGEHSVEAHEIVHTLGAVNRSAPHSTASGHCWDESDTMCYYDGGHAMVQVCPAEREYLLDCSSDDYFSTFPDPGSYLDSHWNAADSRFLIGGGDGSGGGAAGTPTVLGATLAVNNPAVPGLTTQVQVDPVLPDGRTVRSISWKSARTDCTFSDPTAAQSLVGCPATVTTATTVTATVVDSTGAIKTVTSPLTFATGGARTLTLGTSVDGQTGTASVCTAAKFPVRAQVVDAATGLPVRGLPVTITSRASTATTPTTSVATSTAGGEAVQTRTTTLTTAYAARTTAGAVYAAATSGTVTAVPQRCAVDLQAGADVTTVYDGDPVVVSGRLTRQVAGSAVAVVGVSLPVQVRWTEGTVARSLALGSLVTGADGRFSGVLKPRHGGALSVGVVASTSWPATSAALGDLTVLVPDTDLTAAVDRTDVGYGGSVVVSGRLTKTSGALTTGAVTSGVAGSTVSIKLTPTGSSAVSVLASARTATDGTWSATVPLRTAGTLSAVFAGATGLPADSVGLGAVTVGTWTPAVTVASTRTTTVVTLTGTVTRTYAGATSAAPSVPVKVYATPAGGSTPVLVATVSTGANGTWVARVTPRVATGYTAQVVRVVGYADASSPRLDVSAL
jgi:hypothetical protein